jgi:hypothetical protein
MTVKNKTSKLKKLVLTPATTDSPIYGANPAAGAMVAHLTANELPDEKKFTKMNLPPLVKCQDVPVGVTISGKLVRLVANFTGRADMRESKTIHLDNNGVEFLFPFSGQIKQTFKSMLTPDGELPDKVIGKTIMLTRLPDSVTVKYGGEKIVYSFDVRLEK